MEVCVLHGRAAQLLRYCDAPWVVIRISVEDYNDAREAITHCSPSPIPTSVRHVVLLFQVQEPWQTSETSHWFMLACTSPILPHLRTWQSLSIVVQDGDRGQPEHAVPGDFTPASPGMRSIPRAGEPTTAPYQPGHDEAFRAPGFNPDLLPTRQLVASCLRMCHTWTHGGIGDLPLPAYGRLAVLRPRVSFMTLSELRRSIGSQLMPFVTGADDGTVLTPEDGCRLR